MNIGILTHYNVASHGAYLQLYAMSRALEERGHKPFVLTYGKNYDFAEGDEARKFQVGLSNVPYYLKKYLVETGPKNTLFQVRKQRELRAFGSATFEYLPYAQAGMDAAVIGADEVFSLQYGVNIMMYGHAVDAGSVFSYAPSFGQTDVARIDRYHVRELIASGLASLQGLSVRDEGSAEVVERLCGFRPPIVCDPALLYDFVDERPQFANFPQERPYAVVYAYTTNMNDKQTVDAVTSYARAHGVELVSLEGYHAWCDRNVACEPVEMLSWFANASAVITDTFHGTISSVITHAPLALFTRPTNTVKLGHLVSQLGIESRVVSAERSLQEVLASPFDYGEVDRRVATLRAEGAAYLDGQLAESEAKVR